MITNKTTTLHQQMAMCTTFPITIKNRLETLTQGVSHLGHMLNSLSYKNVLARGYAIVRDNSGNIISHAESAHRPASIEFNDGIINL